METKRFAAVHLALRIRIRLRRDMDAVCDLSIGGVGLGCVGNIAILALIVLIFVAAAVYCVCFRKRKEPDSAPVQHSKADEEWSRAALAAAADSGGDGLDVGDVEIAE